MSAVRKMVILWLLVSSQVQAASLAVWPINPRLDAPASATLVWVKNNSGDTSVTLQARIFSWQQHNNEDELVAQDDLVVSPSMIEVKPGAQQIFRVVNRAGPLQQTNTEKSYRLLIDEIPRQATAPSSALKFQMRYSLPLFVGLPAQLQDKKPEDRLKTLEEGLSYKINAHAQGATLEINNRSSVHSRLSNVSIRRGDKSVTLSEGLFGYILPSASRHWPLTPEQLASLADQQATIIFQQERRELRIVAEQ